jgi:hypothetical protein
MSSLNAPVIPPDNETLQTTLLQRSAFVAQQSSPQLSALFRARVRLLLDLPEKSTRGWCCSKCGNLKDGYGWKMVRGQRKKKPVSKSKEKRIKNSRADQVDKGLFPVNAEAGPSHPTPSTPAQRNALRGRCSICGTSFKSKGSNPQTVASFPSAKSVARKTRSSGNREVQEKTDAVVPTTLDPPPTESDITPTPTSPSKPQPPSLFHASPLLAHIPISDPTPASSPLPPTSPSSLPSTSTPSSRSASPVGGIPKLSTSRKKKKSGLAQLLADSAARKQQEQQSLGNLSRWGLS